MTCAEGTEPITNDADVIDSRDVMARITYLLECQDDATPGLELAEDESTELKVLQKLAAEAEDYAADWQYGETLIRESYFEDHARELAEDCGMVPDGLGWPLTHIDWKAAAAELSMDYTRVTFDGVDYFIR